MKFNQPDLAFDIGKQVLATPDNVQGFCVQAYKAAVLIALGKDERIKSAMEEFSEQIRRHWQGDQWDLRLEDYGKKAILRVFLRTGHLEGFHEMYMDLWNHMQLSDPDDELIEDLFHFGQDELGRDVIHRNLTEESKYPLARIRNICQFTQRIVKTDRTKLLPLLKEKVGALHITDQASVLLGLASCSKDPTDTVYVISQEACVADELENKKETNYELYLVLATINYHVGNEELTNTYYSQWVQQLLKKHQKLQEYDVYKLKEAGLALEDLKDLNSMNPSEVVAKLWQTEIQKDFKGFMFDY